MNKWYDTLLTTPEPASVPVRVPVIETPVTVAPAVAPTPQPETHNQESPDLFALEVAYTSSGASKAERWLVEETLKERGQTPTPELIWLWIQKARNRERL